MAVPAEDGPWNTPPANTDGCAWIAADGVEHRIVIRVYRPGVYGADTEGDTYGDTGTTYGDINIVGELWDDITAESFTARLLSGDADGIPNADVDQTFVSVLDNTPPYKIPFGLVRTADNLTVGAIIQVWHGYDDGGWTWIALSTSRIIRAQLLHQPGVRTVELEGAGLITDLNSQVPDNWSAPDEDAILRVYRVINSAGWSWGSTTRWFGSVDGGYFLHRIRPGEFKGTWRELLDLSMASTDWQYSTDSFGRIVISRWPYEQPATDPTRPEIADLLVTDCGPNVAGVVSHSMVVSDGNDQLLNQATVERSAVEGVVDAFSYTTADSASVGAFGKSDATLGFPKTVIAVNDADVTAMADNALGRYGRTANFVSVFSVDGRLSSNNLRLIGAPQLSEGWRVLVRRPDLSEPLTQIFEEAYDFTNGFANANDLGAAVLFNGDLYLNKTDLDGANIESELFQLGGARGSQIKDGFGDFVFTITGAQDNGSNVQFFGSYTGTPPGAGRRIFQGMYQPTFDMIAHVCGSEITLEPRGAHIANVYLTPLTPTDI